MNGVHTQPYNVYAGNAGKQQFSAFIFTFGTTTPSSTPGMTNVLMTYDEEAGTGSFNRSRYSNPTYDAKMREASAEPDPDKRARLLAEAADIVFADYGVIPIYWPEITWASRSGIEFTPNKAARGQD